MTPEPTPPLISPHLAKLDEVIEGTMVDVAAFRAVFGRIEQSYGEAARALDRALERLRELTEVRDALIVAQRDDPSPPNP